MSTCVAIIPVRGGSKGIPRKNARLLNGKPLLFYAIQAALESGRFTDVVVSTDDEELEFLATKFGAQVIRRSDALAADDVGLDAVILDAVQTYEKGRRGKIDYVASIQATSPLLRPATIRQAVELCVRKKLDTVFSVTEDRHLRWKAGPNGNLIPDYRRRVNRQELPAHFRETGGVVVCPRRQLEKGTRFGKRIQPIELDKKEAIDIDDRFDWTLAEKQLQRKSIVFRVEGYREIGLGHAYRALTLADRMLDHDITFVISKKSRLAIKLIGSRFYRVVPFSGRRDEIATIKACEPDIVINDILNTTVTYVRALKRLGCRVVNFEDQGGGQREADAVINAMYGSSSANHVFSGADYVCLRDEFYSIQPIRVHKKVENVLVLFGGTDSAGLTRKFANWIAKTGYEGRVTIVIGPGYRGAHTLRRRWAKSKTVRIVGDTRIISKYMADADLAITSGGRTVFELASLGIPMIVASQNKREQSHVMAGQSRGIVNLGLGKDVQYADFERAFSGLVRSSTRRRAMHKALMSHRFRNGIRNVWNIILDE